MSLEELEGFPYGTVPQMVIPQADPRDGDHADGDLPAAGDLPAYCNLPFSPLIEGYLERQVRYAREDAMGTIIMRAKGDLKRLATSGDFKFLGRALAAVVKGVCIFLRVLVSRIRHDVVETFNRSLEWGERSDVIHGRAPPLPVEEP